MQKHLGSVRQEIVKHMNAEQFSLDGLIRDVIHNHHNETHRAVPIEVIVSSVQGECEASEEDIRRWVNLLENKKMIRAIRPFEYAPADLDVLAKHLDILDEILAIKDLSEE